MCSLRAGRLGSRILTGEASTRASLPDNGRKEVLRCQLKRTRPSFDGGSRHTTTGTSRERQTRALPATWPTPPVCPSPWIQMPGVEFIFDVFVGAFPDLRLTIEEIGVGNHTVAARMAFRGTHRGEFQGLPPTNREVAFTSVELNRMENGKVAEHWFEFDQGKLLEQLGLKVIPGPRLLPRILGHQVRKLRPRRPARR
jgi:SnoaL-like polyketide cyclase